MGIPSIWMIDPEPAPGEPARNAWIEVKRFEVAESPIHLDLSQQVARLGRYAKP